LRERTLELCAFLCSLFFFFETPVRIVSARILDFSDFPFFDFFDKNFLARYTPFRCPYRQSSHHPRSQGHMASGASLATALAAVEMKLDVNEIARRLAAQRDKVMSGRSSAGSAATAATPAAATSLPRAEQAAVALGIVSSTAPAPITIQEVLPAASSLPVPTTQQTPTRVEQEDAMDLDEPVIMCPPKAKKPHSGPPPPKKPPKKDRIKSLLDNEAEEEGKDEGDLSKSSEEEGEKNEHGIYKAVEDIVVPDSHVEFLEDLAAGDKKEKAAPLPHIAKQQKEDEHLLVFVKDRRSRAQVLKLLTGSKAGGLTAKDREKLDKYERRDTEGRARGQGDIDMADADNAASDDDEEEEGKKKKKDKDRASASVLDMGSAIVDSAVTFDGMEIDPHVDFGVSGLEEGEVTRAPPPDATPQQPPPPPSPPPRKMTFTYEDKRAVVPAPVPKASGVIDLASSTDAAASAAAADERKKATINYEKKFEETAAKMLSRVVKMAIGQREFKELDTNHISHFLRALFISYSAGPVNMKPMSASLASATKNTAEGGGGSHKSSHPVDSAAAQDLATSIEAQLERMRGFDLLEVGKSINAALDDPKVDHLVKARLALIMACHLGYASFLERGYKPARAGLRCALSGRTIPEEGPMHLLLVVLKTERFFFPILPRMTLRELALAFSPYPEAAAAAARTKSAPPSPSKPKEQEPRKSALPEPATPTPIRAPATASIYVPTESLLEMAEYNDDDEPRLGEEPQPPAQARTNVVDLLNSEKLRMRIDRERSRVFNVFAAKILPLLNGKTMHKVLGYKLQKEAITKTLTHVSLFRDTGYPETSGAGEDARWVRGIIADLFKFLFVFERKEGGGAADSSLNKYRLASGTGKNGVIPVWLSMEDTSEGAALQANLKHFRWQTLQTLIGDIFGTDVEELLRPVDAEVKKHHPLYIMLIAPFPPDDAKLKTPPLFPDDKNPTLTNQARHRFIPRLFTQLLLDFDIYAA
jgi:hypothetical protein